MKEKSDKIGHECHVIVKDDIKSEKYSGINDFLIDKLLNGKDAGK